MYFLSGSGRPVTEDEHRQEQNSWGEGSKLQLTSLSYRPYAVKTLRSISLPFTRDLRQKSSWSYIVRGTSSSIGPSTGTSLATRSAYLCGSLSIIALFTVGRHIYTRRDELKFAAIWLDPRASNSQPWHVQSLRRGWALPRCPRKRVLWCCS